MKPSTIDKIGTLRASIADLQAELKELETLAKGEGDGAYEGDLFRITISTSDRKTVAWKKIADKMGASNQMIAGNTSLTQVTALRCSSKLGKNI